LNKSIIDSSENEKKYSKKNNTVELFDDLQQKRLGASHDRPVCAQTRFAGLTPPNGESAPPSNS
jgi:hypothetical protein